MSTETFDPNVQPATYDPNAVASASMTEAAISHIRKQLAKNPAMKGPSGCKKKRLFRL